MSLNLKKLLSVSTQLSLEACQVIRHSLIERSFKLYMKGDDDPVTDVPTTTPRLITRYSQCLFEGSKCTSPTSTSSEKSPRTSKAQSTTTMPASAMIYFPKTPCLTPKSILRRRVCGSIRSTARLVSSMVVSRM